MNKNWGLPRWSDFSLYLVKILITPLQHITKIQSIPQDDYLMMDNFTAKFRELYSSSFQGNHHWIKLPQQFWKTAQKKIDFTPKSVNEINQDFL